MSLHAAVRAIRATAAQVAGVVWAPGTVPEQLTGFPAVIVYPQAGVSRPFAHASEAGNPVALGVHTIIVQVHVPWNDLELATEKLTDFADRVVAALMSAYARDQFDGTVLTLGDPRGASSSAAITYQIGPDSWGDNATTTLALKVSLDVSIEDEVL